MADPSVALGLFQAETLWEKGVMEESYSHARQKARWGWGEPQRRFPPFHVSHLLQLGSPPNLPLSYKLTSGFPH